MKLPTVINEPATINTPQSPVNPGDVQRLGNFEAQTLSNVQDAIDTVGTPIVEQEALQSVTRDANGNVQVAKPPMIMGKLGEVYQNTANSAFQANLTGQAQNDIAAMAAKTFVPTSQGGYGGDPQAFYSAARSYVSGMASKQYGNQGVALQIGNQVVDQHMRSLIGQRATMDADNAKQSILSRIGDLDNSISAMAASNYNGPEMQQGVKEMTGLWNTLAADPRTGITPDFAKSKIAEMTSKYQATAIVGSVLKAYDPANGGGFEKAQQLASDILTNNSLDLTPAERRQYYDLGMSQIRLSEAQRRASVSAMQPEANQVLQMLRSGQPVDPSYLDDFQQRASQTGAAQIYQQVEIAKTQAEIARQFGPAMTNGSLSLGAAPNATSASQGNIADYITQRAQQLGIDPQIAVRVASSEGLRAFDPSKPDRGGDGGSSFGPFQLHYGGVNPSMSHAGLGDEFTKATGLDARDPATWPQQVDFALQWASKHGWDDWMGAKAQGITGFSGIGSAGSGLPAGAKVPTSVIRSDAQEQVNEERITRLQAIRDGKMPITADPATAMIINKAAKAQFDTQFQGFTQAMNAYEVPPIADVQAMGQQAQLYGTPEQRQQIAQLGAKAQFGKQFEQMGQSARESAIADMDRQFQTGADGQYRNLLEYARNLDKHMATDFAADPYGAAAKYGLNTQSSQVQLDFSNPQNLAAGLRSRAIDAPLIQFSQGTGPVSLIRPGEIDQAKTVLKTGTPDQVAAMIGAFNGIDPTLTRATLDKMSSGGDVGPQTMAADLFGTSPVVAKSILNGLQIAKQDPNFEQRGNQFDQTFTSELPPAAFAAGPSGSNPQAYMMIRDAARARATDLAFQAGAKGKDLDEATIKQAIKDVTGGYTSWNGGTVIMPRYGMGDGEFTRVMNSLTPDDLNGAVSASGATLTPNDLTGVNLHGWVAPRYGLQSGPDGKYLIYREAGGVRQYVQDSTAPFDHSRPFVLDLKKVADRVLPKF